MQSATQIVHWPGNDIPACDEHAQKLVKLGVFMGTRVSVSPCTQTLLGCTNCANEQSKSGAANHDE